MSQGIEDLKEEIRILQARVEELERKNHRPTPVDEIDIKPRPSPYDLAGQARARSNRHKP